MEHVPQSLLERYADDPERAADRAAIELHGAERRRGHAPRRGVVERAFAIR